MSTEAAQGFGLLKGGGNYVSMAHKIGRLSSRKEGSIVVIRLVGSTIYHKYGRGKEFPVVAFMSKQVAKIDSVTVYYGPYGIAMTNKGELAKLAIMSEVKDLIASQIEGLSASDWPDNLEQLARFEKDKLGVNIVSCGTFHVIDGAGKSIDDRSSIEDFVTPVKLPQAAEAIHTRCGEDTLSLELCAGLSIESPEIARGKGVRDEIGE